MPLLSRRSLLQHLAWGGLWTASVNHTTHAAECCPPTVRPGTSCPAAADAEQCEPCLAPWEHWLIDATEVPCGCDIAAGFQSLKFWYHRCGLKRWELTTAQRFFAEMHTGLPLTLYLHGYNAKEIGAKWDSKFLGSSAAQLGVPFKLVTWVWPSEHTFGLGPQNNLDDKQSIGKQQGHYVAHLINHLSPTVPVSLVSHSYGSVPLASALQTLALQPPGIDATGACPPVRRPLQAAMIAGSLDACALSPYGEFPNALEALDRLAIAFNPADKTLLMMSRISGNDRITGLTGLQSVSINEVAKITQWNINPWVHRHHWIMWPLAHEQLARSLRPYFVNTDVAQPLGESASAGLDLAPAPPMLQGAPPR